MTVASPVRKSVFEGSLLNRGTCVGPLYQALLGLGHGEAFVTRFSFYDLAYRPETRAAVASGRRSQVVL